MLLVIGHVIRPHGVHGEVVVSVRTDSPAQRFAVGSVLWTDPAAVGPLTIEAVRPHQGRLLVTFDEVHSRAGADELRGVLLCADSESAPELTEPDEYHDHQLVGLRVELLDGTVVGDVVKIDHAPAHDLLVLRLTDGRPGLVPFVRAIVPEVDLDGGRIVLTPPPGLFDL